jgi:hypothetical protein
VNIQLLAEFGKKYTWADSSVVQGHTAQESAEIIVSRFGLPITPDEYLDRSRRLFVTNLPKAEIMPGKRRRRKSASSTSTIFDHFFFFFFFFLSLYLSIYLYLSSFPCNVFILDDLSMNP